jgi:cytochrome c biogenesis protein CcmG/thiol:disulfide interchange protein DsbE
MRRAGPRYAGSVGAKARFLLPGGALLVIALLLGIFLKTVVAEGSARGLREDVLNGERPAAPALELERLDGKGKVSLASLRGKAVVVNFWASWCEPCKEESPRLEEAWLRDRDAGVVVVGVDAHDFKSEATRFVERYGLTYPIAHDGPGGSLGRFGVAAFPETLFIDREGRIVAWVQGPVSDEDLAANIERALEDRA